MKTKNNVRNLTVGTVVVLQRLTPPKHRDMLSASIINAYAVVTHIPDNSDFVYGRFVIGNSQTKIKNGDVNWVETKKITDLEKEKYIKQMQQYFK